jgi:hypothetical protein
MPSLSLCYYKNIPTIFMKLILPFIPFLCCSCGGQQTDVPVEGNEPAFTNLITVREKAIKLNAADSAILKSAGIMKLSYYKTKADSGFVYRTRDVGCYTVSNNTFTNHASRKVVTSLSYRADFFKYGDSLYAYNYQTHILKPFITSNTADSFTLYPLPKDCEYISSMPFGSNGLLKQNGQFRFVYNYCPKKGKSPNYIDKHPFLIVTDSNQLYKFGNYPEIFFKEELQASEAYFTVDSSSNIFYMHPWLDSLYKISSSGEYIKRTVLHQFPKRGKVSPPSPGDIAYIRTYEYTNEKNIGIIAICQNKYVVIIKCLAAKKVLDKPVYKLFVFNTDLQKLYQAEIHHEVHPVPAPNNKGFLLFASNFSTIYYYELP